MRLILNAERAEREIERLRKVLRSLDQNATDYEASLAFARAIDALRESAHCYRAAARRLPA